jgi:hypothetical protein
MPQPLKLKYNAQAAVPNLKATIETRPVPQDAIAANAQTQNRRNSAILSHSFGLNAQQFSCSSR